MAGLAPSTARLYELCVTALLYPLSLYLPVSNTAWHFCWCIIQWGTNYPGSWYKEIFSLPYCCSSSSYFVNREFPAAGHGTTHCKVNYIPISILFLNESDIDWLSGVFWILGWTWWQLGNLQMRHRWIKYLWLSPPTKCDQNKLDFDSFPVAAPGSPS